MTSRPYIRLIPALAVAFTSLGVALGVGGEENRSSLSMGNPNEGGLRRGVKLPTRGEGYYSNPHTTNAEAKWGTEELVSALQRAGADVESWAPGATLIINDLGFREGGEIPHHQSHQAGRDVDTLFYMLDAEGKVLRARAVRFDAEGKGSPRGSKGQVVQFDTRRNWYLMKSLVSNPDAHLQRVFVAERLRKLMLDYATAEGEPRWAIERAADAMCQPGLPHDDHFHLRLFCTAEDYRRGCRDAWPIFPWRRTELAGLGIPHAETAPPRIRTGKRRRRRPRRSRPGRLWCP